MTKKDYSAYFAVTAAVLGSVILLSLVAHSFFW